LSAVATPIVFGATWLFRSVFDLQDSVHEVGPHGVAELDAEPLEEPMEESK
jgi:hypothetical protein